MQSRPAGLLENYNSLTDENLAGFFASPEKRRYLQQMGLITRDGHILDEETVRLFHLRMDHRKKSRQLMAEALVKRAVEIERRRRGELKKTMQQLAKFEIAEKVKHQARYPVGVAHLNLPPRLSQTFEMHQEQLGLSPNQLIRLGHMVSHVTATRSLPSNYVNPYTCEINPRPPSVPRPINSANLRIRRTRTVRPNTAPGGFIVPEASKQDKVHANIKMKFCFLGGGISIERSCSLQQQIEVYQQHCGGNTLCLFKGYLKPKDEFVIISRRHHGMPLGLTLFVDGMIYCRLSSCCEYKHKPGHMIGGRSGQFRLIMIEGGRQCSKCESKAATSVSKRRGDLFELVTSSVSTTKQENQETQHENETEESQNDIDNYDNEEFEQEENEQMEEKEEEEDEMKEKKKEREAEEEENEEEEEDELKEKKKEKEEEKDDKEEKEEEEVKEKEKDGDKVKIEKLIEKERGTKDGEIHDETENDYDSDFENQSSQLSVKSSTTHHLDKTKDEESGSESDKSSLSSSCSLTSVSSRSSCQNQEELELQEQLEITDRQTGVSSDEHPKVVNKVIKEEERKKEERQEMIDEKQNEVMKDIEDKMKRDEEEVRKRETPVIELGEDKKEEVVVESDSKKETEIINEEEYKPCTEMEENEKAPKEKDRPEHQEEELKIRAKETPSDHNEGEKEKLSNRTRDSNEATIPFMDSNSLLPLGDEELKKYLKGILQSAQECVFNEVNTSDKNSREQTEGSEHAGEEKTEHFEVVLQKNESSLKREVDPEREKAEEKDDHKEDDIVVERDDNPVDERGLSVQSSEVSLSLPTASSSAVSDDDHVFTEIENGRKSRLGICNNNEIEDKEIDSDSDRKQGTETENRNGSKSNMTKDSVKTNELTSKQTGTESKDQNEPVSTQERKYDAEGTTESHNKPIIQSTELKLKANPPVRTSNNSLPNKQ